MANIDNDLQIIKEAGRGEDVRAAIWDAITKISQEKEYPAVTKLITENGTYSAEGNTAWNKVEVRVPGGGLDPNKIDYGGCITENGYYTPAKLYEMGYISDPECIAVDGFDVQVNQFNAGLCEKMITENGEYDPLLDGFDGYSKVYVNVTSIERKDSYTVRFYNGSRYLGAVTVPHGANATCPSGNPTDPNFSGWNPNPANVTRDMTCYAVYGTGTAGVGKTVSTIADDWNTIVANMNAGSRKYKPGDTKTLILNDGVMTHVLNMMLLGYNMDTNSNGGYAHSTWINVNFDIKATTDGIFGRFTTCPGGNGEQFDKMHGNQAWWGNSLLRALLNGDPKNIQFDTVPGNDDLTYFNALAANNKLIPALINAAAGMDLFKNIKEVQKNSFYCQTVFPEGSGQRNASYVNFLYDQPTRDKIWIPSTRELCYPKREGGRDNYMCTTGTCYSNPNKYGLWIKEVNAMMGNDYPVDTRWISRDCDYGNGKDYQNNHRCRRIRSTPSVDQGWMDPVDAVDTNTANLPIPVGFCL